MHAACFLSWEWKPLPAGWVWFLFFSLGLWCHSFGRSTWLWRQRLVPQWMLSWPLCERACARVVAVVGDCNVMRIGDRCGRLGEEGVWSMDNFSVLEGRNNNTDATARKHGERGWGREKTIERAVLTGLSKKLLYCQTYNYKMCVIPCKYLPVTISTRNPSKTSNINVRMRAIEHVCSWMCARVKRLNCWS